MPCWLLAMYRPGAHAGVGYGVGYTVGQFVGCFVGASAVGWMVWEYRSWERGL
jgi:hypothetical protein